MDEDHLDLTVPFGAVGHYVDLKGSGKLGRIQRLWNRCCGLRLRIDRLEAELHEIQQKLVQEDPSFFKVKHNLNGFHSFPFQPELKAPRRSGTRVAARNAIILRASSLTAYQICSRLDSYSCRFPRNWIKDFPEIKNWVDAYRHEQCRPRVEKLISQVKAQGRLL
jgi:hypothetical protein